MVQIANRKLRQLFLPCLFSKDIQPSGTFFPYKWYRAVNSFSWALFCMGYI